MADEMKDVALEILAEQTERNKKDISESSQYFEMGFINSWGLATFDSTTVIIYPNTVSNTVSAGVLRRVALCKEEGYVFVERYQRSGYNYMVFRDPQLIT